MTMARQIQERLLTDRITVRKPFQSVVPGTKKPVFEYRTFTQGIKARFNPVSTALDRNVLGKTPKRTVRLFLNEPVLSENDEVIWEGPGQRFIVTQVKYLFGHHVEAVLEEK